MYIRPDLTTNPPVGMPVEPKRMDSSGPSSPVYSASPPPSPTTAKSASIGSQHVVFESNFPVVFKARVIDKLEVLAKENRGIQFDEDDSLLSLVIILIKNDPTAIKNLRKELAVSERSDSTRDFFEAICILAERSNKSDSLKNAVSTLEKVEEVNDPESLKKLFDNKSVNKHFSSINNWACVPLASGGCKDIYIPVLDGNVVFLKPQLGKASQLKNEKEKMDNINSRLSELPGYDKDSLRLVLDFRDVTPAGGDITLEGARAVGDLDHWLQNSNLSVEDRMKIIKDVFTAFAQLHEAGYASGDPKPDNFLVFVKKVPGKPDEVIIKMNDFGRSVDVSEKPDGGIHEGNMRYVDPSGRVHKEADKFGAAMIGVRVLESMKKTEKYEQYEGVEAFRVKNAEKWGDIAFSTKGKKGIGKVGAKLASLPKHAQVRSVAKEGVDPVNVKAVCEGLIGYVDNLRKELLADREFEKQELLKLDPTNPIRIKGLEKLAREKKQIEEMCLIIQGMFFSRISDTAVVSPSASKPKPLTMAVVVEQCNDLVMAQSSSSSTPTKKEEEELKVRSATPPPIPSTPPPQRSKPSPPTSPRSSSPTPSPPGTPTSPKEVFPEDTSSQRPPSPLE